LGHIGAPAQQAHPAPWPPPLLADWVSPAPTENELNWREVFSPPHLGHSTVSVLLMLRTSFSNFELQDSQTYS